MLGHVVWHDLASAKSDIDRHLTRRTKRASDDSYFSSPDRLNPGGAPLDRPGPRALFCGQIPVKVAIGYQIQEGPWGGGNRFVSSLVEALGRASHEVVFDLMSGDIDLILMIDPRWRNPTVGFTPGAILRYLWRRNPRALVVHRVNECDERKGTKHMNALLARANYCADHTVFVGSWLRDLPTWRNVDRGICSVILNGADTSVFNARGHQDWDGRGPLKIVTHHWGGNWMKGFDVYQRLDEMLVDPAWSGRIAFSYIGNLPKGFAFRHALHVPPLETEDLADRLRHHHVYLTASRNEPGGNHQNEGAFCGLPLLYRDSGCLPEYCDGFGIVFTPDSFEAALGRMIAEYPDRRAKMRAYPHTAAKTTSCYLDLFERLVARRDEIRARRRLWRDPLAFARNQLPF